MGEPLLAPRSRCAGSASDVAAVMKPFVKGPGDVSYALATDAQTSVLGLQKHGNLLKALFELQPNLLFADSKLKKALAEVGKEWGLSKSEMADFKVKASKMLSTMLGHTGKAWKRKKQPEWVKNMLLGKKSVTDLLRDSADRESGDRWVPASGSEELGETECGTDDMAEQEETEQEEKGPEQEDQREAPQYYKGWDTTKERAWRKKIDGNLELAEEILMLAKTDMSPPFAVFADKSTWPIPSLTTAEAKIINGKKLRNRQADPLEVLEDTVLEPPDLPASGSDEIVESKPMTNKAVLRRPAAKVPKEDKADKKKEWLFYGTDHNSREISVRPFIFLTITKTF